MRDVLKGAFNGALLILALLAGAKVERDRGAAELRAALRGASDHHERVAGAYERELTKLRRALRDERGRDWRGCYVGTCLLPTEGGSLTVTCRTEEQP